MSKRGRPPHPDILTPREWEVLGFVRDGLSNEQIAARLGISLDGVKYHVSEILSKLGLENRHDAARWSASGGRKERPWWAKAVAPLLLWRRMSFGWLSPALTAGLAVVVAAGIGLLVWALLATRGGGESGTEPVCVDAEEQLARMEADGLDFSWGIFQTEERRQCGVLSVCVDGAGGIEASEVQVQAVEQALDTALARATHLPGVLSVERRVVQGCPPATALTGEPLMGGDRHSILSPAIRLLPGDAPSPHRLFVYFAEPELYAATFGDDQFAWVDAELECEGDPDNTPAHFEDVPSCPPVTEALYFPPSIEPDMLLFAVRGVLMLIPPEEFPTPDWHACALGTPEPWCAHYDLCVSGTPEPSCEDLWESTGLEPPQ
jgi:DNA-binding CsgD family transcriptional regulator